MYSIKQPIEEYQYNSSFALKSYKCVSGLGLKIMEQDTDYFTPCVLCIQLSNMLMPNCIGNNCETPVWGAIVVMLLPQVADSTAAHQVLEQSCCEAEWRMTEANRGPTLWLTSWFSRL